MAVLPSIVRYTFQSREPVGLPPENYFQSSSGVGGIYTAAQNERTGGLTALYLLW